MPLSYYFKKKKRFLSLVDAFLSNGKKMKNCKTGGENKAHRCIGIKANGGERQSGNTKKQQLEGPGRSQWPFGTYFSREDIYE